MYRIYIYKHIFNKIFQGIAITSRNFYISMNKILLQYSTFLRNRVCYSGAKTFFLAFLDFFFLTIALEVAPSNFMVLTAFSPEFHSFFFAVIAKGTDCSQLLGHVVNICWLRLTPMPHSCLAVTFCVTFLSWVLRIKDLIISGFW